MNKRKILIFTSLVLALVVLSWGIGPDGARAAAPGDPPRYFSHPNYANSPLPTVEGAVIPSGNPLIDRAYASDFPVGVGEQAPVLVVVPSPLPDGMVQSFQTRNQATPAGSPFPSTGNVFRAYVLRPTGVANEYLVVFDSGQLTVPHSPTRRSAITRSSRRTSPSRRATCSPSTARASRSTREAERTS